MLGSVTGHWDESESKDKSLLSSELTFSLVGRQQTQYVTKESILESDLLGVSEGKDATYFWILAALNTERGSKSVCTHKNVPNESAFQCILRDWSFVSLHREFLKLSKTVPLGITENSAKSSRFEEQTSDPKHFAAINRAAHRQEVKTLKIQ